MILRHSFSFSAAATLFFCSMFVEPSPLRANLLLSEIESDSPGLDRGEFVELYNSGTETIQLTTGGYALVVFDGQDQRVFNDPILLQGQIAPGAFWVIGGSTIPMKNQLLPRANCFPNAAGGLALVSGLTEGELLDDSTPGIMLSVSTLFDAVVYGRRTLDLSGLEVAFGTTGRPYEFEGALAELYTMQKTNLALGPFNWSSGQPRIATLGQPTPLISEPIFANNLADVRQLTNPQVIKIQSQPQVVSPPGAVGTPNTPSLLGSIFLNDSVGGVQLEGIPMEFVANFPLGGRLENIEGLYSGVGIPQFTELSNVSFVGINTALPVDLLSLNDWKPEDYDQRLVLLRGVQFVEAGEFLVPDVDFTLVDENQEPLAVVFRFSQPEFFFGKKAPFGLVDITGLITSSSSPNAITPRFESDLEAKATATQWVVQ